MRILLIFLLLFSLIGCDTKIVEGGSGGHDGGHGNGNGNSNGNGDGDGDGGLELKDEQSYVNQIKKTFDSKEKAKLIEAAVNDPKIDLSKIKDSNNNNVLHFLADLPKNDQDPKVLRAILTKNKGLLNEKNLEAFVNTFNPEIIKTLIEEGAFDSNPQFGYFTKKNILVKIAEKISNITEKEGADLISILLSRNGDFFDKNKGSDKKAVIDGLEKKPKILIMVLDGLSGKPILQDIVTELNERIKNNFEFIHNYKHIEELSAGVPVNKDALTTDVRNSYEALGLLKGNNNASVEQLKSLLKDGLKKGISSVDDAINKQNNNNKKIIEKFKTAVSSETDPKKLGQQAVEIYKILGKDDDNKDLANIFKKAIVKILNDFKGKITVDTDGPITLDDEKLNFSYSSSAYKYLLNALVEAKPTLKLEYIGVPMYTPLQYLVFLYGKGYLSSNEQKEGFQMVKDILENKALLKRLELDNGANILFPFTDNKKMLDLLENKLGKIASKKVEEKNKMLHQAIKSEADDSVLKYLVDRGANVDLDALELAARYLSKSSFEKLSGMTKSTLGDDDWDRIFLFSLGNKTDLALAEDLLKKDNKRALAKTKDGNTALRLLLTGGRWKDQEGKYEGFSNNKYLKLAMKLVEAGAPITGKGTELEDGLSPAAFAVFVLDEDLLKAILKKAEDGGYLKQILDEKSGKDQLTPLERLLMGKPQTMIPEIGIPLWQELMADDLIKAGATVSEEFLKEKAGNGMKEIYKEALKSAEKK